MNFVTVTAVIPDKPGEVPTVPRRTKTPRINFAIAIDYDSVDSGHPLYAQGVRAYITTAKGTLFIRETAEWLDTNLLAKHQFIQAEEITN